MILQIRVWGFILMEIKVFVFRLRDSWLRLYFWALGFWGGWGCENFAGLCTLNLKRYGYLGSYIFQHFICTTAEARDRLQVHADIPPEATNKPKSKMPKHVPTIVKPWFACLKDPAPSGFSFPATSNSLKPIRKSGA